MSHIAIDARELRTSTGRYIERLIHYLQEIDHDNDYTILLKPKDMDGWTPTNPRFKKVASPYKEFTCAEQLGFARQFYGLKADLVHFGMTQQPLLYFGRSVTTIHDLTTIRFSNPDKHKVVFWVKQQVYKVVILWAAWKSKSVITPSQYVARDLRDYSRISLGKIAVTYESADMIPSSPVALPYLQNQKYIMYVGRPTPHKNLDRLVTAFRSLTHKHPALRLVLAGKLDANYRRLKDRLEAEGEQNVVFTDFISDPELRWLYEHAAVYAFPSLSEGFGLPGLEAMQYGTPVASSNATCLPEIYGGGAAYFDPLSTEDIARVIDRLRTDDSFRSETVKAASEQIKKYSWRTMAQETLTVYTKALTRRA